MIAVKAVLHDIAEFGKIIYERRTPTPKQKRLKKENHNSKIKEAEKGEPQLQNKRGEYLK